MSLWTKSYGVTIQMKATEPYFPVVLFINTLSSQNLILLYTFYFFLTAFENTINNRVIFTIFLRNRGPLICRVNIYHHLKINSCFMFTYFLISQNR